LDRETGVEGDDVKRLREKKVCLKQILCQPADLDLDLGF
jgi:hypothetical protein